MFHIKKRRHKPLFKQFIRLQKNIQNRRIIRDANVNSSFDNNQHYLRSILITKFKKKKWDRFNIDLKKTFRSRKKKFQIYDHSKICCVKRFPDHFKKKFSNKINVKKNLSLFYGSLSNKYFKKQINFSLNKMTYSRKNFGNINFFLKILESRLDSVLYRSFFVLSFRSARQLISHGHVLVNKKVTKVSSLILKKGDLVEVNPDCHKLLLKNIQRSFLWPIPPKYLLINFRTFQIFFNENVEEGTNFSIHFPFRVNINTLLKYYR
jgi:small subunit ribosomal protein S4